MTEENGEETIRVRMDAVYRTISEKPDATLVLQVGGPMPCIAIGLEFTSDDEGEICVTHIDATGFTTSGQLVEYLRQLCFHMESTDSFIVSEDGVEVIRADKPVDDLSQIIVTKDGIKPLSDKDE